MMHHKTFFPIIVAALTILLGLFIYSTFKERITEPAPSPVTAVEYQAGVHGAVSTLQDEIAAASSDTDRVTLLEARREQLLAELVPAEYKDAHLEMVMTISQWIAGYQGDEGKRAAAEERWSALVKQYPWIK